MRQEAYTTFGLDEHKRLTGTAEVTSSVALGEVPHPPGPGTVYGLGQNHKNTLGRGLGA